MSQIGDLAFKFNQDQRLWVLKIDLNILKNLIPPRASELRLKKLDGIF